MVYFLLTPNKARRFRKWRFDVSGVLENSLTGKVYVVWKPVFEVLEKDPKLVYKLICYRYLNKSLLHKD